jgi:hypothetical protein
LTAISLPLTRRRVVSSESHASNEANRRYPLNGIAMSCPRGVELFAPRSDEYALGRPFGHLALV